MGGPTEDQEMESGVTMIGKARYRLVFHCSGCGSKLTRRQVMYSDGVCPLCGVDSGSMICLHHRSSELLQPEIQLATDEIVWIVLTIVTFSAALIAGVWQAVS